MDYMTSSFSRAAIYEPSTLVELLRWRALHQPDQLAYTFLLDGESSEATFTYGELDRQARAIGAWLQSKGTVSYTHLTLPTKRIV